jgi:hypothetical protein
VFSLKTHVMRRSSKTHVNTNHCVFTCEWQHFVLCTCKTYVISDHICVQGRLSIPLRQRIERTSPVKKSDALFVSRVSGFSFLLSSLGALACICTPALPSILLLLSGVRIEVTPHKIFFGIFLACRRVLAHFGRKNPVFDEPAKSSPLFRLTVFSP